VQQCIIARALHRRGYKVSMICHDYGQPDKHHIDGIQIFKAHKPNEGLPVLRFIHPRTTSLWRAMIRADADIYYQRCASYYTGLVSFFCRQTGKKMIFSAASDSDFAPGKQLIKYKRDKLIYEWGLKHADAIIAQSPQQQELCRKNYKRESVYIPSCYNFSCCGEEANKQIDVLWVATIRPLKQVEIFIEIAQRLPELRFRIVGGPPGGNDNDSYYCKIKDMAAMVPNLEFIGYVPYEKIDKHFSEARLFVNTSKFEGFPNTFLQAWALGIPALSFFDLDISFEGQQVSMAVSSIDEMINKIKELIAYPSKYDAIRNTCKKYTARFHAPEKIAAEYSKVVTSLLD